jgi:hypothetical protein
MFIRTSREKCKQKRARGGEGRVQNTTAKNLWVEIIIGNAYRLKHTPIIPKNLCCVTGDFSAAKNYTLHPY